MPRDFLLVGFGDVFPSKPCVKQFLTVGNTLATLDSNGRVISASILTDPIFNLGNGISLTPWDVIKGVIFGFLTKFGVERIFDAKAKTMGGGFRNGFVVGGLVGGLEKVVDEAELFTEGAQAPEPLAHAIFQGVLVQGGIAGLVNALLTLARGKNFDTNL